MIRSFADPEADAFRASLRAWLARELSGSSSAEQGLRTEEEQVALRKEWDRKLFAAGYAGLAWPREFGGTAAGPIVETIFYEESAAMGAPEGFGKIGRVMAGPMIIAYGTDEQRARFLPRMLDGTEVWCMGYSEPGAGSDLAAVSTTAVREGDHYRITGRKIWTSYAHHSDRCLLLVRTSRELPRYKNLSYLLPDMHQPGIEVKPIITAAGDHHFNEVVFDGAIATIDERLGPENGGWELFRGGLAMGRGATVAMVHYIEVRGLCQVLLDCCAASRPDGSGKETAQHLMVQVDLVRWQVMRVAEMEACAIDARPARTVLKLYWSELWQDVVACGLKLRCPRHRDFWRYHYIRAKGNVIAGGTSDIQRSTIAGRVLLRDRD